MVCLLETTVLFHYWFSFVVLLTILFEAKLKPLFTNTIVVVSHSTCLTLCDPMDCSTPGFPVLHHLPQFAQTHVYGVSDAIQPSCSVVPFSSCRQSFPASGSFPMSQLLASGDQSIGVSASTEGVSVLAMNIQGWNTLGLTGLISLQTKGLSRVFSNTTVQNHQFFST